MLAGEPWFVAADVCEALELETHVALRRLDDDEKGRCSVPTLGGQQEMVSINESGLYSLILTSRKACGRGRRNFAATLKPLRLLAYTNFVQALLPV